MRWIKEFFYKEECFNFLTEYKSPTHFGFVLYEGELLRSYEFNQFIPQCFQFGLMAMNQKKEYKNWSSDFFISSIVYLLFNSFWVEWSKIQN